MLDEWTRRTTVGGTVSIASTDATVASLHHSTRVSTEHLVRKQRPRRGRRRKSEEEMPK